MQETQIIMFSLKSNHPTDPTAEEINQALQEIQWRFPHLRPLNLLARLHQKLIENSNPSDDALRMQIGRSFYHCGYGYTKYVDFLHKEGLTAQIKQKEYKQIIKNMVLQLYRALERLLVRKGGKIKLKHCLEMAAIERTVLNYKSKLTGAVKNALVRLLTKLYILPEAVFSLQDANILYNFLQSIFKKAKSLQQLTAGQELQDADIDYTPQQGIIQKYNPRNTADIMIIDP